MAFWKKDPSESAYIGGKKHWTDVIKNSGPGELLIWRQPEEDFNTNSTLIVMPGEQAIFVHGGRIEQVFESGTYKLTTENYPFIGHLRNSFSGGVSVFSCVVYFVRTAHSKELLWGTTSPVQVRDKLLNVATKIRARGSYKINISNPAIFLEKLVGNNVNFQSQEDMDKYFANELQGKIRSVVVQALNDYPGELLGIEAKLDELSNMVEPAANEMLQSYGLSCAKFVIAAMDIDDDELRRRYDEVGMEAMTEIRRAQAQAGVMNILGDNWGKQQAAQILGDLAKNPGAGGVAAAGAGMGMGIAASGVFGGMAGQLFEPMKPTQPAAPQPSQASRFAPAESGAGQADAQNEEILAKLSTLKRMLDDGLIEQAEFDARKKELIDRMCG